MLLTEQLRGVEISQPRIIVCALQSTGIELEHDFARAAFAGLPGGVERVFFFKQKTAYEIADSDWSSDVCSSDLIG